MVASLREYAKYFAFPIQTGAKVLEVHGYGNEFHIVLRARQPLRSRAVVLATSGVGKPFRPSVPGQAGYRGIVLHSCAYGNPNGFE